MELQVIARIHNDFPTKFGIPRQSGRVPELRGTVVFEPQFRNPDALRGIEGFSHLWLIWGFSQNAERANWTATGRPPRLGGNTRMGVFATRSPNRPNPIGLSCVRLEGIGQTQEGTVLYVAGADLADGTPIYDIKPYLPAGDCFPEAKGGFADGVAGYRLRVEFPPELLARIEPEKREGLIGVLADDPRPSYQNDPERVYGFGFAGRDIRFRVAGDTLTVVDIVSGDLTAQDGKNMPKQR